MSPDPVRADLRQNRHALVDLTAATMTAPGYGLVADAAIVIEDGIVEWVGHRDDLDPGLERRSVGGRVLTPGLVDCHTHLVFGGDRAGELASRISGATYEEIAAAGGGIRSTVAATRTATPDTLLAAAARRLDRLHHGGATTVEIKSGYGLDLPTELGMLRVARRLGESSPVQVTTTLLAAHIVPDEWRHDPDGYVDLIVSSILPAAVEEGLVDAVDAFCEPMAFTPAQVDRVFAAARTRGLPVKIHAGQLTAGDGIDVAVRHHALSADHLEHATEPQVAAMTAAGTVAVLLPGATHTLQERNRPPVASFRRHGVPMALASDLNPGTSPVGDLALVANLAVVLYGLTPEEALAGLTHHAAAALGMGDRGIIAPGMRADLAAWDISHPDEIAYWAGMDLCSATWVDGTLSFDRHEG